MKKSINRKHSIVLAAILATVLTACGAPATAAVTTEDIQPVVEKAQEVAQEVVTEEVVEEVVAEPTPEPTPEPIIYEGIDYESTLSAVDWAGTFVGIIDEPKGIVYNEATNKHEIIENGKEVKLEQGDEFSVYLPNYESIVNEISVPRLSRTTNIGNIYIPTFDMEYFTARKEFTVEIDGYTFTCYITPAK